MLTRIDGILNRESFEIQGGFFFQDFYREVFRSLRAPCDLIATADATRNYFWRGRDLNDMFREFIERGGSLTRIFFLNSLDQLQDNATLDIMRGQHLAGVKVYYVVRTELREARFMLADRQKSFGWILHTAASGEIDRVQVSWNAQTADECSKYLLSVLEHEATMRFNG